MFIAAFLSVLGLGLLAWIIVTLTVYALPAAVGVGAGLLAYKTGAGATGASLVAIFVGGLTLGVGQRLFEATRSPALRGLLASVYAAPAAFTAYHAVLTITEMTSPSEIWRQVFALAGAVAIGAVAWNKVAGSVHS